jgi:hypothetical protein
MADKKNVKRGEGFGPAMFVRLTLSGQVEIGLLCFLLSNLVGYTSQMSKVVNN